MIKTSISKAFAGLALLLSVTLLAGCFESAKEGSVEYYLDNIDELVAKKIDCRYGNGRTSEEFRAVKNSELCKNANAAGAGLRGKHIEYDAKFEKAMKDYESTHKHLRPKYLQSKN